MKNIRRFLRRFLTGLLLCFLLFAALNLVIFLVGVVQSHWGYQNFGNDLPARLAQRTSESLSKTEKGGYTLPGSVKSEMKRQGAWAMLLDGRGKVVWQTDLPNGLPRSYTPAQIAEFSRYYLEDYPVFCWEHSGGLVVLGYPKNSYTKNFYISSVRNFWMSLHWLGLLLGGNVALLILLYAFLSWRTVKPIEPILNGVQSLSRGEPVLLEEKGLFSEIAAGLNRTSALLRSRNEALKEKEKARTEWIAGVSHDIRTPLSVILGYAGELEEDESLPAPARKRCSQICEQGIKLRDLVRDLNLMNRLEYSMQPLSCRPVPAARLLREAVTEFLNGGVGERYRIEIGSVDETVRISADERLLKRAVTNLLQNSTAHNPDGCSVTVSLKVQGKDCLLEVEDDGVGIEPDRLRHLRSVIRSGLGSVPGGGHGLGLRMVSGIARAHGGVFRLTSQPGRKTKAVLILPYIRASGAEE